MDLDTSLMTQFRRASAMSRRMRRESREQQEGAGEKHVRGMGHILEALNCQKGISQRALAQAVGVRPQSISEALILLETRGEIRREPSPQDRRVTLVFLTSQGEKRREEKRAHRHAHAHRFFEVLTQQEKETMLFLLKKINDDFEEKEGV